jgi:hypothetical protein
MWVDLAAKRANYPFVSKYPTTPPTTAHRFRIDLYVCVSGWQQCEPWSLTDTTPCRRKLQAGRHAVDRWRCARLQNHVIVITQ